MGWMVQGWNSGGGEIFHTHPDSHGAQPSSYTMGTASLEEQPWRGVDHPPSSSAEGKERVELYTYSPSQPS